MRFDEVSAIISAASALLAFGFSVFVYATTRKLLRPTERPMISLFENKAQGEFLKNPPRVKTGLLFLFKNIGKRPAQNLRVRMGVAPKASPERFRNVTDVSVANRIDVDSVFNWNQTFEQGVELQGDVAQLKEIELYIYILLTYEDCFEPRKKYCDEFWLTYTTGRAAVGQATVQEKMTLEPYVKSIYQG